MVVLLPSLRKMQSARRYNLRMCRNIKTLANFCPPATDDEIRASALQFVRKLSGMNKPSRANEPVFNRAVDDVTAIARQLVADLVMATPPRNREEEARKARERARVRFASEELTPWRHSKSSARPACSIRRHTARASKCLACRR